MPVKQQNSSENAASTWSLIRQATLCTTWAWGVVIWSQTCVYTQPLLYHNRLFQQSLTKWHQHSQRIHVTQNKHKATHDQLNQTASFGGVTFSASVVQLGKALVRLLFSSLFLAHENIDTHADKYTLVPHLSVTVSSVLWQKRLWGPLVFYIPVVIYNSAPLKKKKGKKSTNSSVFVPEKHVQMVPSHLPLLSVQFFGRPLLLGLPQMAGDGDGVHTGGHGFGWDLAELLPVWVVFVQALNHLSRDALWPDAGQSGDLLRLRAVGVHRPELATSVTEQHQEVVGFRFLHFIKYLVFLPFVDLASQAAVSQSVLDDVLVGLGTGLLV